MTKAKDPVCGMDVDEQLAADKSTYQGKTYFFCSRNCKEQFDRDPARFLKGHTTEQESRRKTSA